MVKKSKEEAIANKRVKFETQIFSAYVFKHTLVDEEASKFEDKYNKLAYKYVDYMGKQAKVKEAYLFLDNLSNQLNGLKSPKADQNAPEQQ